MSDIRIPGTPSEKVAEILKEIPEEVVAGTVTTGYPFPPAMEGIRVLVLGCGTGRDAYIASKLVGDDGMVIGIDPDADKIAVARKNAPANCQFIVSELTNLEAIVDSETDLVISIAASPRRLTPRRFSTRFGACWPTVANSMRPTSSPIVA